MKYKVLVIFSGKITAYTGEEIEITDQTIADDLLQANYITKAEEKPKRSAKGSVTSDEN